MPNEFEKPKFGDGKPEMPDLEKASDIEIAVFLIKHINNPCGTEVAPGRWENIRSFYIREAERILPKLTNPKAIQMLKDKIAEYPSHGGS